MSCSFFILSAMENVVIGSQASGVLIKLYLT